MFIALLLLLPLSCPTLVQTWGEIPRGAAKHVVLVVWDGMRPDFVSETQTPNLWKLAQSGVTFRNHHSIYPSVTNVNAAALATGVNPGRSGLIGNWAFRPDLGSGKLVRTDSEETIRKGDAKSQGKYLAVPTIAELLHARGGRSAVAGTKSAALLHNRSIAATEPEGANSVTIFSGDSVPPDAVRPVVAALGSFPKKSAPPDAAPDAWTTRALTEVLWKAGVPEFSVLWLSEPDRSQHAAGPGSNAALRAIKSADDNLGLVLRVLDGKGLRGKTNILVASDHGFSAIDRRIDITEFLHKSGFDVASGNERTLARGQVRVAASGGTVLYYVGENDSAVIARLIGALQATNFAGVIFSRERIEGTFSLAQVHLEVAAGPDVAMTFHWHSGRNDSGVPGMIAANDSGDDNKATHGTLSPFDLHNTFVAAGPDFRSGVVTDLPTSNTDVGATIMHLLGLHAPEPLDGRVVKEAMTSAAATAATAETNTLEATRDLPGGRWRQYLRTSKFGGALYLEEGNGEFTAKPE